METLGLIFGDDAEVVNELSELAEHYDGWDGDAARALFLRSVADHIERQSATIAQLRGELERMMWGTVAACADEIDKTARIIEKSCDGYEFDFTKQRLRGMRDAVKILRATIPATHTFWR